MSRWPKVPLGELVFPANNWIPIEPDTLYRQVTARLWGKGLTLRAIVRGSDIAASSQNRVSAGQLLISKIDARHGAFGLVPMELDGAVVSADFPTFDVNQEYALPGFLRWVASTDWFVELCRKASEGSTNRVRLKEDRFLSQTIPLPPLDEQRRIVARLDAVAARIADQTDASTAVGDELAATLRNAFAKITEGAPRRPMAEIAPLVRRPVEIDLDSAYPELGVRSFGRGTFHKPPLPGGEVGTKKLFEIHADDLVFNIVFAWEGAVAVASHADHGRFGSHRFLTCVPVSECSTSHFLRFFFSTSDGLKLLDKASPGGAGRNRTLGLKALEAIEVPVPSLDAQRWFDTLQAKAGAVRTAQAEASSELDRLLPSLLHQAFG